MTTPDSIEVIVPVIEYSDTEDDQNQPTEKLKKKPQHTVVEVEQPKPGSSLKVQSGSIDESQTVKPSRPRPTRSKKSLKKPHVVLSLSSKPSEIEKDVLEKEPVQASATPSSTVTDTTDTTIDPEPSLLPLFQDPDTLASWKTPGPYAIAVHNSTRLLYLFLKVVGRFPSTTTTIHRQLYMYQINWNWKKAQSIYFHVVTAIMTITLFLGLLNVFLISFRVDVNLKASFGAVTADRIQTRELAVLHRNFIMFVTIGGNIINGVACSGFFYIKRKLFPNYMGCFPRNVQAMKIDPTTKVQFEIIKHIGIVCLVVITMLIFTLTSFGSACIGGSTLLAVLLFRLFIPDMLLPIDEDNNLSTTFYVLQGIGMVLMIVCFVWSKAFIILYLAHAKMLLNAASIWNGRLYNSSIETVDRMGNYADRTTMQLLFRDHCILLDLLDGTNDTFEGILESCYLTEAGVLPWHVYYIYRTCKYGYNHQGSIKDKDFFIRPFEFINAFLLIMPYVYLFLTINILSGDVSSELQTGLEILRRESLLGRTTDQELLYLLSMYTSYNSPEPIELGGGGFAGVNKDLMVGSFGVLVFFTLIVAQYYPTFDYSIRSGNGHVDLGVREEIGRFIEKLEGLCHDHWRKIC